MPQKIKLSHRFFHLFGVHRYEYVVRLSEASHLCKCPICQKRFVLCTSAKVLVPWDQELQDMYVKYGCIQEDEEGNIILPKRKIDD